MNSLGQGGQSEATHLKSRVPVTLSRIAMKKGRSARSLHGCRCFANHDGRCVTLLIYSDEGLVVDVVHQEISIVYHLAEICTGKDTCHAHLGEWFLELIARFQDPSREVRLSMMASRSSTVIELSKSENWPSCKVKTIENC